MTRPGHHVFLGGARRATALAAAAAGLASPAPGQGIPSCDAPPPGAGNCAVETPGVPGCTNPACCKLVCDPVNGDPFCCDVEWDDACAAAALQVCGPLNDDCADATPLVPGVPLGFDNTTATTDGFPAIECTPVGGFQIFRDLWYRFTPSSSGTYVASLCGSEFDTIIAVYQGCAACPPAGAPLGCRNNDCFMQSEIQFAATGGQCYLIRVGGQEAGDAGEGTILVTSTTPPPANDACTGATLVAIPSTTTGSTVTATPDTGAPSPCAGVEVGAPGVWYRVQGNGRTITATTCRFGTDYDTQLSVYCGDCADLACVAANNDQPGPVTADCDVQGIGVNSGSTVSFCSEAGRTYLILVHGFFGAVGAFELRVTDNGVPCPPPPPCDPDAPPANDACAAAATIGLGDTPFTTVNATTDGPPHAACSSGGDNQVNRDVWYRYTSDFDGELTVTTCGLAGFDTRLAVYAASSCPVGGASLLACNDNDPDHTCGDPPDLHSRVVVAVADGVTYTIRAGGTGSASGTGTLRLEAEFLDPNCPGAGDCRQAHPTPGCADETCCNLVCADLPACCDVAWSQACADHADLVCPPPPPCTLDGALCQDPDQASHGAGAFVAAISDANPSFDFGVADDFTASESGSITEVCWWGLYALLGPPVPGDCGPGPGDQFTFRYYQNASGTPDRPGALLAGPFTVPALRGETGLTIDSEIGELREYEYTAAHPAVAVTRGQRYWIEILNHTAGDCVWLWSTAPPGDGLCHQAAPSGSGYNDLTALDFDMAWCVDLPAPPCPWDLAGPGGPDGVVSINDLLAVLGAWGPCPPPCPADLDGSGAVGVPDLLALLFNWGPCP